MTNLLRNLQKLSPATQWLLFISFTFNIGSFVIVPFIAVYLHTQLGFSLAFVSVQLTLKLFSQRGMMLLGGIVSDRLNTRLAMALGCLLRISSFFLYALGRDAISISVASLTFGLASALFVPASKSALSQTAAPGGRTLLFSLRSTANNLGMALGGLLGSALIALPPLALFSAAAGVQSICALLLWLPRLSLSMAMATPDRGSRAVAAWRPLVSMLGNPIILQMAALYIIYIALYAQLEFTLPLAAANLFSSKSVGLLFFCNTATVFLLQIPLNYYLGRRFSLPRMIVLGFVCIALAMVGFHFAPPLAAFLALISIYTLGEVIIDPAIDAMASSQVAEHQTGTLFGLLGSGAMAGGLLGNWLGATGFAPPGGGGFWLVCAAIAASACLLLLLPVARFSPGRLGYQRKA
ncbi:MFS transporter [Chromobacterium alticapitis]|uniref:MFS transporter n=1 Tax=Chromobacterium alticapitis TaxID=2073169 RepID=UPI0011B03261|nr:MFS transporter [Chromobacterium alticapitis]